MRLDRPAAAHKADRMTAGPPGDLALLFEISQLLDSSLDLHTVVEPVLDRLARARGLEFATLALLSRQTEQITIEAASGLSPRQKSSGRYRLGEGITGSVVQTGKAVIVPRISQDPRFLNRTGARGPNVGESSFICVPVRLGKEVLGTLSGHRPAADQRALRAEARFLTVVASLIARAVRLRQAAQEERERLAQENARLQDELQERYRPPNLVGNSRQMQAVYRLVSQVHSSDTTVLLRGESGTGKELVAHAIHRASPRANRPFVKVNCAALPEGMIESELFGHEAGAFTGALRARKGRFELAHGGTLFLDEVGDLPLGLQVKLLRVVQEREFERVGGTSTIKADVRVIAATSRDLERLVQEGQFRLDLYYRLAVFPIHIPPLRERKTDILLLADHFVEQFREKARKRILRISTPAIDLLMAYAWPGNVRELENCIQRAVLLSDDEVIHGHHLPPAVQDAGPFAAAARGTLASTLESVERELLVEALKSAQGNLAAAARSLGITRRVMGLRVRKHGIAPRRFRSRGGPRERPGGRPESLSRDRPRDRPEVDPEPSRPVRSIVLAPQ